MLFMVVPHAEKLLREAAIAQSLGLPAFPIAKLKGRRSVSEG
jgi:hypothetical protein